MDPVMYRAAMEGNKMDVLMQKVDQFEVQVTPNNNTVLHIATLFGNTECVEMILRISPSLLRKVNDTYETPLHIAVKEQYVEIARVLIKHARSIPRELESGGANAAKEILRMTNEDGDTALHDAVRNGDVSLVKMLIEEDPEFSHPPNKAGETPLYLAAENKLEDCVSAILSICKSPSPIGPNGRTTLHAAAIFNCEGIMTSSLNWKPDLAREVDGKGWTPLHYAANYGHVDRVTQLLDLNVSLAYVTTTHEDDVNTALHIAAIQGHVNVMENLLSKCPDCWEMFNGKGQNIVHIALENKKDEVIKFILNIVPYHLQGRLIRQKDVNGNTPLHLLADSASKCVVPELITHPRAYHMAFNNESMTPFDIYKLQAAELFPEVVRGTFLRFGELGRRHVTNIPVPTARNFHIGPEPQGGQRHVSNIPAVPTTRNFHTGPEPQGLQRHVSNISAVPTARNFHTEREPQGGQWYVNSISELSDIDISVDELKRLAETNLIVATLIATVSFAAGFTLPGGYDGSDGPNKGMAVLTRKAAFKAFVIVNAISMMSSSTAIYIYFLIAGLRNKPKLIKHQSFANFLVLIASSTMMLSFITGIYVVITRSAGLAISVWVLGVFFFLIQRRERMSIACFNLQHGMQ